MAKALPSCFWLPPWTCITGKQVKALPSPRACKKVSPELKKALPDEGMRAGRLTLEGTGRERKLPPLLPNHPSGPPSLCIHWYPLHQERGTRASWPGTQAAGTKNKMGKRKGEGEVVRS